MGLLKFISKPKFSYIDNLGIVCLGGAVIHHSVTYLAGAVALLVISIVLGNKTKDIK